MLSLQKQLTLSIDLANKKHANQKDKGKQPYILHPLAVMNRVKTMIQKIAAILHDIVEDTDVTLDDLRQLGFDEKIVIIVDCVTRRKEESYLEYLKRILDNEDAVALKLADMAENKNLERLKVVRDFDLKRYQKYLVASVYLEQYFNMSESLRKQFEDSIENIQNELIKMKHGG